MQTSPGRAGLPAAVHRTFHVILVSYFKFGDPAQLRTLLRFPLLRLMLLIRATAPAPANQASGTQSKVCGCTSGSQQHSRVCCQQSCSLSSAQLKVTSRRSTSISVHSSVCCSHRSRGASGKWGSELMRLILALHPLWKLSQACFGNIAGIFMSGICKGIFILVLETAGPAARLREHRDRGKKHKTSKR